MRARRPVVSQPRARALSTGDRLVDFLCGFYGTAGLWVLLAGLHLF